MKRALRYLGGLSKSMVRKLTEPGAFRPDLQQAASALPGLVRSPAAGQEEGAGSSDHCAQAGRSLEDLAVAFFSRPDGGAGLSADDVPSLVAEYRKGRPAWCGALLAEADQISRRGLPVYHLTGPPISDAALWRQPVVDRHGDRLYQLRPHRFGFLPRMAIAAALGTETLPPLLAALDHWADYVEETGGAEDAYFSNLVVIYRLLAITWAAPFVVAAARGGDPAAGRLCLRLFQILACDSRFLWPRLGQSVGNNHLLADRFVAWFLTACYPGLCPETNRQEVEQLWVDELRRQFYPDGTNFELSVHYHELGCEMALAYLVAVLSKGERPGQEVLARIAKMLRFQAVLADSRGNTFALGDGTDDPLLPLDADCAAIGGTWPSLYAALFKERAPAPQETVRGGERAYWLLAALTAGSASRPYAPLQTPDEVPQVFPDGGYIVFDEGCPEQKILFRTGPRPGVAVWPGHAMSDLLSVYWHVAGQPVLTATGTYAYCAEATGAADLPDATRDYFRSPAAHNGLILKGHDPLGVPKGRFRRTDNDTRAATRASGFAGCLAWAEGRLVESGPLDGHRRTVIHVPGHYAVVCDHLPSLPADAELALHWHLAPAAQVTLLSDRQTCVTLGGVAVHLCASGGTVTCVMGQVSPPAGWVSRRYGQVEPAPQLICPVRADERHMATLFMRGARGEAPACVDVLEAEYEDESVLLEVRQAARRDILCLGTANARTLELPFDIDFAADLLWLHTKNGRCEEIRGIGLRRLTSPELGIRIPAEGAAAVGDAWERVASEPALGSLRLRRRRSGDG